MEYDFFPLSSNDREEVIDIFNYYVENSFAAYPERRVHYEFFDILLQFTVGYPTSHIPQMYTEVELICLFAQNHPLENGPTFRLLPF
jgi:phosphinothricin acetyltransferase